MTITGTVVKGAVIPDAGTQFPEGARVHMALATDDEFDDWPNLPDETFPPDHPMAPFNREVEIAILRESIAEVEAGYPGRPFEEVMAEIAAKYNLPPVGSSRP